MTIRSEKYRTAQGLAPLTTIAASSTSSACTSCTACAAIAAVTSCTIRPPVVTGASVLTGLSILANLTIASILAILPLPSIPGIAAEGLAVNNCNIRDEWTGIGLEIQRTTICITTITAIEARLAIEAGPTIGAIGARQAILSIITIYWEIGLHKQQYEAHVPRYPVEIYRFKS
jgi:hypothetical protein